MPYFIVVAKTQQLQQRDALRMKFVQARCGAPCRKQLAELRVKAVESTQDGWGGFAS
jgi:hypothetical protein